MNVQRRIKAIMSEVPDKRRDELGKLAGQLGCSLSSVSTDSGKFMEEEVIRRIQEAARSHREHLLWLIALIAAVAAALSALAAWFAVLKS